MPSIKDYHGKIPCFIQLAVGFVLQGSVLLHPSPRICSFNALYYVLPLPSVTSEDVMDDM